MLAGRCFVITEEPGHGARRAITVFTVSFRGMSVLALLKARACHDVCVGQENLQNVLWWWLRLSGSASRVWLRQRPGCRPVPGILVTPGAAVRVVLSLDWLAPG